MDDQALDRPRVLALPALARPREALIARSLALSLSFPLASVESYALETTHTYIRFTLHGPLLSPCSELLREAIELLIG